MDFLLNSPKTRYERERKVAFQSEDNIDQISIMCKLPDVPLRFPVPAYIAFWYAEIEFSSFMWKGSVMEGRSSLRRRVVLVVAVSVIGSAWRAMLGIPINFGWESVLSGDARSVTKEFAWIGFRKKVWGLLWPLWKARKNGNLKIQYKVFRSEMVLLF